jgi:hypothetical protein
MKLLKAKTQPAPEQSRFDVFISYSRDDDAFVRRLYDALNEKERRAWVDWKGIPPSADWMAELYAAIQSADNFVLYSVRRLSFRRFVRVKSNTR